MMLAIIVVNSFTEIYTNVSASIAAVALGALNNAQNLVSIVTTVSGH